MSNRASRARNILQAAGVPAWQSPFDQPLERRRIRDAGKASGIVFEDGRIDLCLLGTVTAWDETDLPFDDAVESLRNAATVLEVMAS